MLSISLLKKSCRKRQGLDKVSWFNQVSESETTLNLSAVRKKNIIGKQKKAMLRESDFKKRVRIILRRWILHCTKRMPPCIFETTLRHFLAPVWFEVTWRKWWRHVLAKNSFSLSRNARLCIFIRIMAWLQGKTKGGYLASRDWHALSPSRIRLLYHVIKSFKLDLPLIVAKCWPIPAETGEVMTALNAPARSPRYWCRIMLYRGRPAGVLSYYFVR